MLFPKPYILKKRHDERHNRGVRCQLLLPCHIAVKPFVSSKLECLLHVTITSSVSATAEATAEVSANQKYK